MELFISHASEDKKDIARPLAERLKEKGYRVWYDEYTLKLGDSLSEKIDQGLHSCRYGIVILSESFFNKNWPKRELEGLVSKEMIKGAHCILPVWHGLTPEQVYDYSPPLANRLAVNTSEGLDRVVEKVIERVGKATTQSQVDYLDMSLEARTNEIQRLQSVAWGYNNDLGEHMEFASFIEAGLAVEEDELLVKELERAKVNIQSNVQAIFEEIALDNPSF